MNNDLEISLRAPVTEDGHSMWTLVKQSGALDINSCYLYLLLGQHFSETCIIAESGGTITGFLSAYRPPQDGSVLFIWQIGIDHRMRKRGIGSRIVEHLLDQQIAQGVKYLEATVSPSNEASMRLFRSLAQRRGVDCKESPLFTAEMFGHENHEAEILFRLGPFV